MSELVDKLHAIDAALTGALLPHAFGGAIALAYCTQEPRGTRDLDLNVVVPAERAADVLAALPDDVSVSQRDVEVVRRVGQTRLWWGDTPVDVFLNNHPFHEVVADGVRWVDLGGREVPVLDCASLIVFKALFDRTKDWADIEAMAAAAPAAIGEAADALREMTGADDPTAARLTDLVQTSRGR